MLNKGWRREKKRGSAVSKARESRRAGSLDEGWRVVWCVLRTWMSRLVARPSCGQVRLREAQGLTVVRLAGLVVMGVGRVAPTPFFRPLPLAATIIYYSGPAMSQ